MKLAQNKGHSFFIYNKAKSIAQANYLSVLIQQVEKDLLRLILSIKLIITHNESFIQETDVH